MTALIGWIMVHPQVLNLGWVLLTGLLTAVFKPRSAEEYAALSPRVAAVLKFMSAMGLDPVKAVEAVKQLVTGTAKAPEEMK